MALLHLPNELKAVILVNAWNDVKSAEDIYQNDLLRVRLQSTCRTLKNYIDDFPLFWSCISVEMPRKPSKAFEIPKPSRPFALSASCKSIRRHISRSGTLPLHVAFNLPVCRTRVDLYTYAWNRVVNVAGRWESLFLSGANWCSELDFVDDLGEDQCVAGLVDGNAIGAAVRLKQVNISMHDGKNRICRFAHEPTRLVSNHLQIVDCQIPVVVAFSPSNSLQYLDITINRTHNWTTIFSPCTNLTHLHWYNSRDYAATSIATLPSLTTLTLNRVSFPPPILAPNLSTLEVTDKFVTLTYQLVVALTGPLATKLATLLLSSNPTHNTALVPILRHCPYIREFSASVAESRTAVYQILCERLILQYRRNRRNGFKTIKFKGGPSPHKAGSRARYVYAMLSDLCETSELDRFTPFLRGTSVVICNFPLALSKEQVSTAFSSNGPPNDPVSVIKVWVAEHISFGCIPRKNMNLVVLLDLDSDQAIRVAKRGFLYGGKRYWVQCNIDDD
ncbi:hypothetical protein R3P38DRAFT_2797081 [Favolaschia claudopus]|uniref:F-box domain-containing protein n=1 Tax=Favolaschia claudopus TaxID=2862362 RepID=A0AAW0A3M2_9AGAR